MVRIHSSPMHRAARPLTLLGLMVLAAALSRPVQAQGWHEPPAMGGPGMMRAGPHAMHGMLEGINATPEQRLQIRQIMQAAHDELRPQHEAVKALHQRSQALFAQPNVDAVAAESLRQQISAQHDAESKRMLQAMLDVSRVLTPEQRKTLSERMTQRHALMERQHAEREALDKLPR
jgi:Spy/CpxP family protein refolding chaperone